MRPLPLCSSFLVPARLTLALHIVALPARRNRRHLVQLLFVRITRSVHGRHRRDLPLLHLVEYPLPMAVGVVVGERLGVRVGSSIVGVKVGVAEGVEVGVGVVAAGVVVTVSFKHSVH